MPNCAIGLSQERLVMASMTAGLTDSVAAASVQFAGFTGCVGGSGISAMLDWFGNQINPRSMLRTGMGERAHGNHVPRR